MTNSQKLTIRASEIRQEADQLGVEYRDTETKLRAAVVAEGAAVEKRDDNTGEGAELRALQERAELRHAISRITNGFALEGAEKELAAARGLTQGNSIPWDLLATRIGPEEHREDAATTDTADINATVQRTIIGRVFSRSATMALGVSMESVGAGESVYPVITAGASAEFKAADALKEAQAMTFDSMTLAPVRLQGRYLVRREDLARVPGIEEAMRRDLSGTLSDTLDAQNLAGSGVAPNLPGFLATAANGGLAAATDEGSAVTFETAAAAHASGVDGKYAGSEKDVAVVAGADSYAVLAGQFQAGSGESATSYALRMLRAFRASANIPARDGTSKNQQAILARLAAGDGMQNAVCPVWDGLTIIRDEVTQAAAGQIAITAVALYSFRVLRTAAFLRLKYRLSA